MGKASQKTDQWHCPPFFDLWPHFFYHTAWSPTSVGLGYSVQRWQLPTAYSVQRWVDNWQLPATTNWMGPREKKTESEFLVLISYCQFPVSTIWRALYHILSFFSLSTAMVEGTVDHGFENLFRTSENWGQDLWAEKHWSRPHTNSCLQLTGCSQRPFNARPQCSCMATQLVFYMHFYIHKGRVVRVVQICLTAAIAPTY